MSALQMMKLWLIDLLGLGKDALHVYVGLAVFFASAALLRRRVTHWLPLALVALVAAVGEGWDIRDRLDLDIAFEPIAHWHDWWNTMFWPTMLFVLARTTRLFERGNPVAGNVEPASDSLSAPKRGER